MIITNNLDIQGFFQIKNLETGEILLEKNNSINYENMSVAIANTLSGKSSSQIYTMVFGNGGSIVNGTGAITYLPPNVNSTSSTLYNQTYEVSGLTGSISNTDSNYDANNTISINHTSGTKYTDIIVICTLGYDKPSDQSAFDNTNLSDQYVFDELGLQTQGGTLLTHAIFAPTAKALNVSLQIQYTLRITTV